MLQAEVQSVLQKNHIRLNQNLGQHFLIEERVLEAIIESGNIEPHDTIVEIGAGIGILTKKLMQKARKVFAIEIDEKLIPILKEEAGKEEGERKLEIIGGNALHVEMPKEGYKVIANIPYHITSPLLRHIFLESIQMPTSLTLLIQKEVAENICHAENGGILKVLVGLFGTAHMIMTVKPECFLPPPKVDSAIIHIDCDAKPKAQKEVIQEIFRLTKIGFSQKRKMLRNSLGKLSRENAALKHIGIELTRRPQTLSTEEWIALATQVLSF